MDNEAFVLRGVPLAYLFILFLSLVILISTGHGGCELVSTPPQSSVPFTYELYLFPLFLQMSLFLLPDMNVDCLTPKSKDVHL